MSKQTRRRMRRKALSSWKPMSMPCSRDSSRKAARMAEMSVGVPRTENSRQDRGMAGGLARERRPERRVMQSTLRPLPVMTSAMAARLAAVMVRPRTVTMCRRRPCMPTQRS